MRVAQECVALIFCAYGTHSDENITYFSGMLLILRINIMC